MPAVGMVYLVGAGPGDPGLLTLRGRECLRRAEVVLYDGLVNPLLLRHTAATTTQTNRTQGPAGRVLDQDEINRQLIEHARAGKTVVRLKGGDPFIFGRGSEEADALAAAGVPFEVVPGVTAAVAAGAYAGISLTHRQHASAVAFVTGHEDPAKPDRTLDYRALAAFPGTLVFYMGRHRLPEIARALVEAGKDPQTPAALISRATTPLQRTVTAPLVDLPLAVEQAGLHAPSLIIVGQCVRLRDTIAWYEQRPLLGRSIGITRPAGQACATVERVLELGAEPVLMPTIEIRPPADWTDVDRALGTLAEFDWLVFTSVNGVEGLLGRLWQTGGDARRLAGVRLAAIGSSTAEALGDWRLHADLVPDQFRAEALAEALSSHVAGRRVLWARASRGRDVLPAMLREAGADVTELVVYHNVDASALPPHAVERIASGRLDWIGLGSPSIARNLAALLPPDARARLGTDVRLASISPVTTAAARDAGLTVAAEASVYTWDGLLDAIAAQA